MARQRTTAVQRRASVLQPWEWRWARSEPIAPLEEGENPFSQFGPGTDAKAQAIWDHARNTVLAEWAEQHPGEMPPIWWLMDAPGLWAAKGLGEPPVDFRFFAAPDSWHETDAKAQRPFLEKMGVAP